METPLSLNSIIQYTILVMIHIGKSHIHIESQLAAEYYPPTRLVA